MKKWIFLLVIVCQVLLVSSPSFAQSDSCASWLDGTWSFKPNDSHQNKVLDSAGGSIEMIFSSTGGKLEISMNGAVETRKVSVEKCSKSYLILSKAGEKEKIIIRKITENEINITTTKKPEGDEVQTFVRSGKNQ